MRNFSELISYSKSKHAPRGHKREVLDEILGFVELENIGLSVIFDFNHFVDLIIKYFKEYGCMSGHPIINETNFPVFLYRIANYQKSEYHSFQIPKRSGGSRTIMAPNKILKDIQRFILYFILSTGSNKQGAAFQEWGWRFDLPLSKYAKA